MSEQPNCLCETVRIIKIRREYVRVFFLFDDYGSVFLYM